MVAYEFYVRDKERGNQLLGILPERRENQERVNEESIMKWAEMAFSSSVDMEKVFFIPITLVNDSNHFYSIRHKKSPN